MNSIFLIIYSIILLPIFSAPNKPKFCVDCKFFIKDNIRCNSISPGRVHTPFVDGFLKKNYPGKEAEMFDKLSKTQPIGRMGKPIEIAHQVLYLCSDEASFITGSDYAIDGGYVTLNS